MSLEGCRCSLLRLASQGTVMSAGHGLLGLLQQSVKVQCIVLALDGTWTRLIYRTGETSVNHRKSKSNPTLSRG